MRKHFRSTKLAMIKKWKIRSGDAYEEKLKDLWIVCGNVKWAAALEKFGSSSIT